MRGAAGLLGVLVLASAAGCPRGGPPPKLVPVRGKVLYRNKPLPGARFVLEPDRAHRRGLVASATTGEDGSFIVSTYLDGFGEREGAMPGKYRLVFKAYPGAELGVPDRYRRFEETPLLVDVPGVGRDNLTFNVVD